MELEICKHTHNLALCFFTHEKKSISDIDETILKISILFCTFVSHDNSWNNCCLAKTLQVLTDIFVDFWQPANLVWWARFFCKFELYHACDIAGIVMKKKSLDVNLHITRFLLFRLNYCLKSNSALLFTSIPSKDLICMHFYSLLYHQRILFSCSFIQYYTINGSYLCMHFYPLLYHQWILFSCSFFHFYTIKATYFQALLIPLMV